MPSVTTSRREALAFLFGGVLAAAEPIRPVRLAISESMVMDVNLNDARVAMLIWLKQMASDLNVVIDFNPKVFNTTAEIVARARSGQLDAVAVNILEYRQMTDVLDSSQVIAQAGEGGKEQYLLMARRDGEFQELGNLKGRRLCVQKSPRMCVANAWLSTVLDEGHFDLPEQFFGSVIGETKVSRVVLPVFFGQTDACLTTKRTFDTMCELNPLVGKGLRVIASSPPMVLTFYVYLKNFHGVAREKFTRVFSELRSSASGRQLATLFQFDAMTIRDGSCLVSALSILDAADRIRARRIAGGQKGSS